MKYIHACVVSLSEIPNGHTSSDINPSPSLVPGPIAPSPSPIAPSPSPSPSL